MEEKRGRRCCLPGFGTTLRSWLEPIFDIDGLRLSKESQFIRAQRELGSCERVSRQIYANALQRPIRLRMGFVGIEPQPESLILAQNERWRQA